MKVLLDERFQSQGLAPALHWFCEPASWRILPSQALLEMTTDARTDFWQRTHYGFRADNGHFLYAPVSGDFRIETRVSFAGINQYDQAGLLMRASEDCWLKTSVEFEPDAANRLGAVVTRAGYSDWSTQDVDGSIGEVGLRVTREGSTFLVEASLTPDAWSQIRLAHLEAESSIAAGLYACSPKGEGFRPRFQFLRIEAN